MTEVWRFYELACLRDDVLKTTRVNQYQSTYYVRQSISYRKNKNRLINCSQPHHHVEGFRLSLLFRYPGLPGLSTCTGPAQHSRNIHDQCLYIRRRDLCDTYVRMQCICKFSICVSSAKEELEQCTRETRIDEDAYRKRPKSILQVLQMNISCSVSGEWLNPVN